MSLVTSKAWFLHSGSFDMAVALQSSNTGLFPPKLIAWETVSGLKDAGRAGTHLVKVFPCVQVIGLLHELERDVIVLLYELLVFHYSWEDMLQSREQGVFIYFIYLHCSWCYPSWSRD